MNDEFWSAVDALVNSSKIIIDRKKGTAHPRYPDFIYPVDYGYIDNTSSMDKGGIDVWLGSDAGKGVTGIIATVDLFKRDSEIKILIDMTDKETELVNDFHNNSQYMKGILIKR